MKLLPALVFTLLTCSAAASAQDENALAARRALIEREQQSAIFSLQLQQSQQKLGLGADSAARLSLDALHLDQLHRFELLGQQDLQQLTPFPGYDRARRESERNALLLRFQTQAPAWGPRMERLRHWTPSAEMPKRRWTPTLE